MRFLGVQPMFWQDWFGMACFAAGACFLMPWWVAIPLGVLTWRALAT